MRSRVSYAAAPANGPGLVEAAPFFNRYDARAIKPIPLGGTRRLELMAQVFNLFGSDNKGGTGQAWVENALSDSFGRLLGVLPRQQAELGVRFLW